MCLHWVRVVFPSPVHAKQHESTINLWTAQLCAGLQRGSDYYVMLFDTSNGTKDMKAFCDMQLPIGIISIDIAPCGTSPHKHTTFLRTVDEVRQHTDSFAGLFVLIVCKGRFYLWDVSKNGLHCNQEVSVDVTAAAFTATGDHFVVVGTRSFSCWEVCRGQVDGEVCTAPIPPMHVLTFLPRCP